MTTVHRRPSAGGSVASSPESGRNARLTRDICHARIVGRMSTRSETPPLADETAPGARQLARGITATWWYTVSAVLFFEAFLVLVWALGVFATNTGAAAPVAAAVGGVASWLSTLIPLADYRHRADAEPGIRWLRIALPLSVAVAFGAVAGGLSGSWLLAAMPVVQTIVLLNWPRGVRARVVLLLTGVLVCLAFIDGSRGAFAEGASWWLPVVYTVLLPVMTVSSLWWWDVLVALDRARTSEARLAATQERLRVATDVHDLQGHHLQVIALQLELAERLMDRDPAAAAEQVRAARASVDEARQGTRDLAMRFRGVPLGDELANARDLLGAAGLAVRAEFAEDADRAPASVLGPVIRETTTNVLRHGGGRRARLALQRTADAWRYEIANDAPPRAEGIREGSGLDGMRRRIAEVGGTFEVQDGDAEFVVVVTVPVEEAGR